MASAPRASLLASLPPASRRSTGSGLLAARCAPLEEALPTPQLQIRSFSGWADEPACWPGVGRLASPSGIATAAAGPLSTSNYLRLSFAAPLPAAVLAAQPEIWLFTPSRRHPAARHGLLGQAGWDHPGCEGAVTEFCDAAVQQGWAQPQPFTSIVLDANHWVASQGQLKQVRHFRFALVVNPAGYPALSGKRLGPLSREVWLGANPRHMHSYALYA